MNEKINVLGVNIDSFTAKEAMKETIAFLELSLSLRSFYE